MAALAYLFLPLSGTLAFVTASDPRVRFHGLQAIVLGLGWGVLLWGASWIAPVVTQLIFLLGLSTWVFFLVATARGRDPRLPGLGRVPQVDSAP